MIESHETTLSEWQLLFRDENNTQVPQRINEALANPEVFTGPAQVPKLVTLVDGARIASKTVDPVSINRLLVLSFDTILIFGAAPGFGRYQEFFDSSMELINELNEQGAPVSQLLLSAARFQAGLANGDRVRRSLIERAVETSQTLPELMSSLLIMAKFLIDVSDYRGARRVLDRCRAHLDDGTHPEFMPDLEATTGLSHYYSDPDAAREHFETAIRLGQNQMNLAEVRQPVANATHFLGRLAADSGEHRQAIELYAQAEKLSDDYLTGHGFYHQRIAEVLVSHGTLEETYFHLKEGAEAFKKVGQVSNGLALLEGVWARWHLRQGNVSEAEHALLAGIKKSHEHTVPRAEMVLLLELMRLRLRQHRFMEAGRLSGRIGWQYLQVELSWHPRRLLTQLRTAARAARRILRRPGPIAASRPTPIQCPCGARHQLSSDER